MRRQVCLDLRDCNHTIFDVLRMFRDFATNLGIRFYTPEEYFLHEDARPFVRAFDPATFLTEGAVKSTTAGKYWDCQPHGR